MVPSHLKVGVCQDGGLGQLLRRLQARCATPGSCDFSNHTEKRVKKSLYDTISHMSVSRNRNQVDAMDRTIILMRNQFAGIV